MAASALASAPAPAAATATATTTAASTDAANVATRPKIVQRPIAFGPDRKRQTRAYARRHYGLDTHRLHDPKVIVQHFTVTTTFRSVWNTFDANAADVEFGERPGVCAHFVVDRDGTTYQLVPLATMCRHTVGLNWTAIGIEHVGTSAKDVLGRPKQRRAIAKLTAWLRCREGIAAKDIIGHAQSLSSPYHRENVAKMRTKTHGDWTGRQLAPIKREIARLRCPAPPAA